MIHTELDLTELAAALRELDQNVESEVADVLQQVGYAVAAEARSNHSYTDRTHDLTTSIESEQVQGHFAGAGLYVDVVADTPYAKFVEEGTKKHVIRAKHAKALRFYSRAHGRVIFRRSVQHPGTKPYKFLAGALERLFPKVQQDVLDGVVKGFARSGFEMA